MHIRLSTQNSKYSERLQQGDRKKKGEQGKRGETGGGGEKIRMRKIKNGHIGKERKNRDGTLK